MAAGNAEQQKTARAEMHAKQCQDARQKAEADLANLRSTTNAEVNRLNKEHQEVMDKTRADYDERYRKCNPGIINEVQFLEDNPLKHVLVHLDSGASAGSFVESIWPGRRLLVSGKWVVSGSPSRWCRVVQSLQKLKRRVR